MHTLSKSQYCKGRKCLKRIWLYNYHRELMAETSTFQESILTQGKEVGILARQLYPEGELIHEDHHNLEGALGHTHLAIQRKAPAIFEGAFLYDNVLIRVDILVRNENDTYDLIEVKSSTKLKEKEHLPDCAIQAYVLQQSGFQIKNICVAFLNNHYMRKGELDLTQLFIVRPVNELLEHELQLVPAYLDKISNVLATSEEPSWKLGSICKNPYPCEFKHYCWKDVPEKSIHYLYNIRDKFRFKLMEMGIELIQDIPSSLVKNAQLIQVEHEKTQLPYIDSQQIVEHLSQLNFPLYFLDFETLGYAIPPFDNTRPYQRLPFQYSLHVKQAPDLPLKHLEFLFDKYANPMRAVAEQLVNDVGPSGSIIVYNKSFEEGCIRDMIKSFPDLAPMLNSMLERLWDLLVPFGKKWYYHPDFNGSASIKKVLPVLVPELSYKSLGIQQGDDAQAYYLKLIKDELPAADRNRIKNDLLAYCRLDTLAMVRILDELRKVTSASS
ncbi:hypothetical protein AQULUS_13210 [Aquicella lusitana]|uniref:Uncharacterized protein DUF83 n=2 Tax=Aquicella lusitana TaxID=254246 RepID=A0A370GHZ4_9COXI|nr:uncharacterized protein DUF83 [Aquicella lusitana]VVC73578.1 hypothetical protein AQULUS_13210 [Aquicella lusitana]